MGQAEVRGRDQHLQLIRLRHGVQFPQQEVDIDILDLFRLGLSISSRPGCVETWWAAPTRSSATITAIRSRSQDAAGNTWSWSYDLLGNQTSATDPDTGTSRSTYDNVGQVLTVTDARGKQTTYSYDADGRKTAAYDTTGGASPASGNQIGAWTYDTLKKGYLTSSVSYKMGTTSPSVTNQILSYNSLAKPVATKETLANLPSAEAALAPSAGYTTSYTYTLTGNPATRGDAAAAGLPSETIDYGYDKFGEPTSTASAGTTAWSYVTAVGYDEYGDPLQYTMGPSGTWAALDLTYDPQTKAVTDAKVTDSASGSVVDDTRYTYGGGTVSAGAGLVTSTTDKQDGGSVTDTQCFTYDYAKRLTAAWTATDSCAATPAPGSSSTVGGPNPYWQSWTYDAAGDRLTETDHDTAGDTTKDTKTTYTYPTQGSATDQPHTLTSTTATGPDATDHTAAYGYDAAGDATSISGGADGDQALTWNDQGRLDTDTTSAGTTSYLYDADGNLVLRTDPGQATLFLDDEELVEDTSTDTLSGTRYYTVGDTTVAERSSTGDIQYLIPDRQGTDTLALDYQTLAATRRQYLPFGQVRGTAPTTWPGDEGYVGGTADPTTSLENLGAREYDPETGRFLSPDPVFEADDPTQLGGYDYAGNDAVSASDPTGQMIQDPVTGMVVGNTEVLHDLYRANGFIDSHGHETAKLKRYEAQQDRDWEAYYHSSYYRNQVRSEHEAPASDRARAHRPANRPWKPGPDPLASPPHYQGDWADVPHEPSCSDCDITGVAKGLWDHTYVSASLCLMGCANLGFQGGTVSFTWTGGFTTDLPKAARALLKGRLGGFFGLSAGFATAKASEQKTQIANGTVADGWAGGSVGWGKRTTGGDYYTFGWAGGAGVALQGPTLGGWTWNPSSGGQWAGPTN